MKIVLAVVMFVPLLSGCHAIGVYRMGTAQKAQASVMQKQAYDQYALGIERLNIDREKQGLAIKPIKSFDEWSADVREVNPIERR